MFENASLRELLAKASPLRSGDILAGVAASSEEERVHAQMTLADVPLKRFLNEAIIPYEDDEVTRLIMDTHDVKAFAPVSSFTVGDLRDWILSDRADTRALHDVSMGLTPEMVAAVSKIMRLQDLILGASKCRVVTKFRSTLGLPGRLSVRLQPNHPTDDARGILASTIDGLYYGSGDAMIGINPATDSLPNITRLLKLLDELISYYDIPTQSCVLTHVTNTIALIERGVPVDLCFQSLAGTEKANSSFGINLAILQEAWEATASLKRGTVGANCMYFETGQGSALSANANFGCDEQTVETRIYAIARRYKPFLVNTVVGFIGPEYLANGKQIIRAGLEDHFCAKLMGVPMGCDICYTNHANADQDDMDTLLTLMAAAGVTYIMGIPGADDIMLNYQSTSFHDAAYIRKLLNLRPTPEFEEWLERMRIHDHDGRLLPPPDSLHALEARIESDDAEAGMGTPPEEGAAPVAEADPVVIDTVGTRVDEGQSDRDTWEQLRVFTDARIAIGRCGVSLPHGAWLSFRLDHARARDAVYTRLKRDVIRAPLVAAGYEVLDVTSRCASKDEYLTRPDLGRRLCRESHDYLEAIGEKIPPSDICVCICDGLSSRAVHENAAEFTLRLFRETERIGVKASPVVLAEYGRVALGDEAASLLRAQVVILLVGERPGLSSPDSMGVYMTYNPYTGCTDEARNCISNVRPAGLNIDEGVRKLCYLLQGAFAMKLSGVNLKDDMPAGYLPFSGENMAVGAGS